MKKLILSLALCSISVGAQAQSVATEVRNAAYVHARYSDVMAAAERCPNLAVNIPEWDKQMSRSMAVVKAFNTTEQGEAWYAKRDADFGADPAKECAAAEKQYGPTGLRLLKKK